MANKSIDLIMHYNAKPIIFERANDLRENMTQAEKAFWNMVKGNQIFGHKFRTQHPIDIFIADFYCHKLKLVVEIDGGIHLSSEQKEYDIGRTAEMEEFGIKIIRFSNDEVLNTPVEVRKKLSSICKERMVELDLL